MPAAWRTMAKMGTLTGSHSYFRMRRNEYCDQCPKHVVVSASRPKSAAWRNGKMDLTAGACLGMKM